MSVIVELSMSPSEFGLGRVLAVEGDASLSLETMVPLGERSIPFFRLHDDCRESFEAAVRDHATVDRIERVDAHGDESLYALDWEVGDDDLFAEMLAADAHLLEATGTADVWRFELRFPSHDCVSAFRDSCREAGIAFDIDRVFNPTERDAHPWYGLTEPQRETLAHAVEQGYYDIPRRVSTKALAADLGVSDQAVTERLRRAIATLVENTLAAVDEDR